MSPEKSRDREFEDRYRQVIGLAEAAEFDPIWIAAFTIDCRDNDGKGGTVPVEASKDDR